MTVEELIERLENAEGANFALDKAIGELFEPERPDRSLRCYTASIDAAVALAEKVLPDSNCWGIAKDERGSVASVQRARGGPGHWTLFAEHKVPAIALCLAIIKAKHGEQRP